MRLRGELTDVLVLVKFEQNWCLVKFCRFGEISVL